MVRFSIEGTGPKFSLDEAVHYAFDGVDVLLRIARVVIEGRWTSVSDYGPLEGEGEAPISSTTMEYYYLAHVLNVNDAGGRSLRPGQLVLFSRGQRAIATAQEFETHGRVIDGIPSERKIQGDERRLALLSRAVDDIRAEFLIARTAGIPFPAVHVTEMEPAGFFKIGPRGLELDGFDLWHYPLTIDARSQFEAGIPEGHIPVVLVSPGDGFTCETLPIEG